MMKFLDQIWDKILLVIQPVINVLHPGYYFDINLGYYFTGFWWILGIALAVLVATIGFQIWIGRLSLVRSQKMLYGKLIAIGYWIGIGIPICLFFRNQSIPYFNWRLWPALITFWVIWSGIDAFRFWKYRMPSNYAKESVKKAKEYFLASSKKKS